MVGSNISQHRKKYRNLGDSSLSAEQFVSKSLQHLKQKKAREQNRINKFRKTFQPSNKLLFGEFGEIEQNMTVFPHTGKTFSTLNAYDGKR